MKNLLKAGYYINMSNKVAPMDTLQIYQRLKKAKASEPLAKEMAEIFRETVEEKLATRNDIQTIQKALKETEVCLQKDIRETENRLQTDLKETEVRLQKDLKETENRLQKDLKETENRLQKDLKETESRLQNELEKMKIELKAKIETDIAKSKSETIKWIIGWVTGLLVAQTGFLFGFLK